MQNKTHETGGADQRQSKHLAQVGSGLIFVFVGMLLVYLSLPANQDVAVAAEEANAMLPFIDVPAMVLPPSGVSTGEIQPFLGAASESDAQAQVQAQAPAPVEPAPVAAPASAPEITATVETAVADADVDWNAAVNDASEQTTAWPTVDPTTAARPLAVVNAAAKPVVAQPAVMTPASVPELVAASTRNMPARASAITVLPAIGQSEAPQIAGPSIDTVDVNLGQSLVLASQWPVARVSITNPEIADVAVLTPNQVLLVGKDLGTTDLVMWSEDNAIWHARVAVNIDLEYIRTELLKAFPDCDLLVTQSRNVLVVSGALRRLSQADQLRATLDSYGMQYVDQTSLAGVQQVAINVRVAEVSREAIKSLGVNTYYGGDDFFGGVTIGPDGGGPINPISVGVPAGAPGVGPLAFSFIEDLGVASGITLFGGIPSADLQIFVEALAENQYLRFLAEPTLVAMSGAEASFLAGGEYPIPVVQGSAAGAGATVTIEYREFGVRLNFVPVVLGENRIRLAVAPEVSDLTDIGAIEIEGFQIPAVTTRRSETTLELNSGQTFAMAGLLNHSVSVRNSRVPLLGDLPILGPLFRSTRYTKGETELVILVSASLVEPAGLPNDFPVPGSLHQNPNDWEFYAEGRAHGATPALGPEDTSWLKAKGLDRLRGPGAWDGN